MYAVTAWMVQPLTCILVGIYMETLKQNTKQKAKNNDKKNKTNSQCAEQKKETQPSKYAELKTRFRRARFMLHMLKMNQRNGIIPENYESELIKWQAVQNEFLEYKETDAAKAERSTNLKVNFFTSLANNLNAQAKQGEGVRPYKSIIKDKLCVALANDIDGFIRPVDKTDWPKIETKLREVFKWRLTHERFTIPQYDCGQIFCGFLLIHCKNKWSKRTFGNCVGKIRNKFKGKRLTAIPVAQIPNILYNQHICKGSVEGIVPSAATNNSGDSDVQHSRNYIGPTQEVPKRSLNSRPPLLPLPQTGPTHEVATEGLGFRPPLLPVPNSEAARCVETTKECSLKIRRVQRRREERYKFCQSYLEQMQNLKGLTQSQKRRKKQAKKYINKYERFKFKDNTIIGPREQTDVASEIGNNSRIYFDPTVTTNNEMRENFSSDQESSVLGMHETSMTKEVSYLSWNNRDPEEQARENHFATYSSYEPGLSSMDCRTIEAEVIKMPESNPFRSKVETSIYERRNSGANANKEGFSWGQSYAAKQMNETSINNERIMESWNNLKSEEQVSRENFASSSYRSGFSSDNRSTIVPEAIRMPEFAHFRSNDEHFMYESSSSSTRKNPFRDPGYSDSQMRQTPMTNETSNRLWNNSDLNFYRSGSTSNETEMKQMQMYGDTKEESFTERHSKHRFHSRSESKGYGQPEYQAFAQPNVGRLEIFNENKGFSTSSRLTHASTSYPTSNFENFPTQDLRMETLDEERSIFHRREYPSTTTVQLKRKSESAGRFNTDHRPDHSDHSVQNEIRSVSAEEARKEYLKAVDYLRKMEFCAENSLSRAEKLRIEICQIRIENYKKRIGSQERELVQFNSFPVGGYEEKRKRRNSDINAREQLESNVQRAYDNYDTHDYRFNGAPYKSDSSAGSFTKTAHEFNDADLQVAIIDRNQKDGKISNEAWANIEYHLLQRLAQEIQATNNPNIGRFDSVYWHHGIKIIHCENVESKDFIERFIRNQGIYWPNTHYDVIPARELPRRSVVKVWIPPPILEDLAILKIIKAQNSKFYSEDWTLIDSRERRNRNGKDMYISISPNSLERLRRTDGEIRFGTNRLQMILPQEA